MRFAALLFVMAACAADQADVPPLGDYTQWKPIVTYGHAPGHGDTYRVIYANDIAETYGMPLPPNEFGYADGTVVVKEVYNLDGDGGQGSLRVIEIMRRIGPSAGDQIGWVFTAASTPNGSETRQDFCWRRCHQAAPFDGAWLDYSK